MVVGSRVRAASAALLLVLGCDAKGSRDPDGRVSQMQRDRYLERAVHESSHGVLFEPSRVPEKEADRTRLGELARDMQIPAARCFIERAIRSMELVEGEDGPSFEGVPDGQLKLRARIGPHGEVLRAEMLESAFKDPGMEQCVLEVAAKINFPPARHGSSWYVDIYYWVSLGFDKSAHTEEAALELRKQAAMAAIRGKACFEGRVGAGRYEIVGLNLFGSEGETLTNRVERGKLPEEVSSCMASAFRNVRVAADRDSFVRPAIVRGNFEVDGEGKVKTDDEEWLRLVLLEERADREARRRELAGGDPDAVVRDEGEEREPAPERPERPESADQRDVGEPPEEKRDPGTAGVIDLNPR